VRRDAAVRGPVSVGMGKIIIYAAAFAMAACTTSATTSKSNIRAVTMPDGRVFHLMRLDDGDEAVRVQCGPDRDVCMQNADEICQSTFDIVREKALRGAPAWTGGTGTMDQRPSGYNMWVHCWNPSPPWAAAEPRR
jgi:hypothetical protein